MKYLFDASAVLAVLKGEPGADRVMAMTGQASISVVNLAEVATKLSDLGLSRAEITNTIAALELRVLEASEDDGIQAGLIRSLTRASGLSLGDRFCLAVAHRHHLIAATTDRSWAKVAPAIGVEIELIR